MKTIFKSLAAFALMAGFFFSFSQAHAQSDNGLIGKAHKYVNDCLVDVVNSGFDVSANVSDNVFPCLIPPCPVGKTVTFFAAARCNPGEICPLFIMLVAVVEFDQNGNVISYTCRF